MKRGLKRFFTKWQNILALLLILIYFGVAIYAPVIAPLNDLSPFGTIPHDRTQETTIPIPPSEEHPLGISPYFEDVFYALVQGTSGALEVSLIPAMLAATVGTVLGAVSGYVGGWFSRLILKLTDIFLTIPIVVGVYLFGSVGGGWSYSYLITLSLFLWMPYTRIIHSSVKKLKSSEYVLASRACGASHLRIIFKHLLPNSISSAFILAAKDVGAILPLVTTFTFIGIRGYGSWGESLAKAKDYVLGPYANPFTYWWIYVPITLAIILFSISWNTLGDGLNDAQNPRSF